MGKVLNTVRMLSAFAAVVVFASCGSGSDRPETGRAQIVVTGNIIGDIVSNTVGDAADVEVIMPIGADPHEFAASARQAEAMERADLLVVNGLGFEQGLLDVIDAVAESGTQVFVLADAVEVLDAQRPDPHVWTDPSRMVPAVEAIAARVRSLDGVDLDALDAAVVAYSAELVALDAEMERDLRVVPDDRRVLVTNHEVFGYFADRFDFEVVGAVIPSLSTNAQAAAKDIEGLAAVIRDRKIPAIFGETTQSSQLAEALAEAVGGDVRVVELFSESLGATGSGAGTYLAMMRANTALIVDSLAAR